MSFYNLNDYNCNCEDLLNSVNEEVEIDMMDEEEYEQLYGGGEPKPDPNVQTDDDITKQLENTKNNQSKPGFTTKLIIKGCRNFTKLSFIREAFKIIAHEGLEKLFKNIDNKFGDLAMKLNNGLFNVQKAMLKDGVIDDILQFIDKDPEHIIDNTFVALIYIITNYRNGFIESFIDRSSVLSDKQRDFLDDCVQKIAHVAGSTLTDLLKQVYIKNEYRLPKEVQMLHLEKFIDLIMRSVDDKITKFIQPILNKILEFVNIFQPGNTTLDQFAKYLTDVGGVTSFIQQDYVLIFLTVTTFIFKALLEEMKSGSFEQKIKDSDLQSYQQSLNPSAVEKLSRRDTNNLIGIHDYNRFKGGEIDNNDRLLLYGSYFFAIAILILLICMFIEVMKSEVNTTKTEGIINSINYV